jgi:glyoxylase-like metal-dependent hydrolase (beta-lactamase superfamily II)
MQIDAFYDERTSTVSYLVHRDGVGVVIDPVLDYTPRSGRTSTESADRLADHIDTLGLRIPYVLDTHAHADHMSALPYFRHRYGATSAIGAGIGGIQAFFADVYGLGEDFTPDGRQFDVLLEDGQVLDAGALQIEALHTPGHTPACISYRIGDALFCGDTLFQPDYGTARCDFPAGSAGDLYDSIQRLFELPGDTRVFTGHDYRPGGRSVAYESTIDEQRRSNVQLDATTSREAFIAFRKERDASLDLPELIVPAMQVNIRAGELPPPDENGRSYLRIPLNTFGAES